MRSALIVDQPVAQDHPAAYGNRGSLRGFLPDQAGVPGVSLRRSLLAAWSPAKAVEVPRYQLVRAYEAFEVRLDEPNLVAETVVSAAPDDAGNQGFRILAGYILGQNKGARRIAMTAPVAQALTRIAITAPLAQSSGPGAYVIQFAMPQEWTLETLPEPLDSRIALRAMPARTFAVIGYSGTWSQHRYEENLRKLQDALAERLACLGMASRSGLATTHPGSRGSGDATRSGLRWIERD